jgi:hypothetical protein
MQPPFVARRPPSRKRPVRLPIATASSRPARADPEHSTIDPGDIDDIMVDTLLGARPLAGVDPDWDREP